MSIFDNVRGKDPRKVNPAQRRLDHLRATKPQRDPVAKEIQRIVQLPIEHPPTKEEVEEFCRSNTLAEQFLKGWRLFDCQVGAVMAYDFYKGGFFPIGVGWGKTLISLMIAERAHRANPKGRTLLLVPSQVYSQLTKSDIAWARRQVPISVQFILLGNKTRKRRLKLAMSRLPGCYILPYSCLSTEDSEILLDEIRPTLIIADEVHMLKNAKAARTMRVKRFLEEHKPNFVAMSGTITSRSIVDYWHLIKAALKENCPLPLSGHLIRQWSGVLDAVPIVVDNSEPGSGFYTEPIMPLVRWARKNWPNEEFLENTFGFRAAYKKRLTFAPGVVVTGEQELGCSIVLSDNPVKAPHRREGWDKLEEAVRVVREEWVAPNGDEIDHAMHQYKWLYELAAGFYNDRYWPTPEEYAATKNLSVQLADKLLEDAMWHHTLLQLYHSALRKWINTRAKQGLDTPMLIGLDMTNNGSKNVGQDLYDCWRQAKDAEFEGMPVRLTRPVRICDFKVMDAVRWAKALPEGEGGILWYSNKEIGIWLTESLEAAGLNPLHCPAGKNDEIREVGDPELGGKADRIVVASIGAHHVGKNLQAFVHQYIVQWPRSAVIAEQLLGRTHRNGQKADELTVYLSSNTELDVDNFAACLNDTAYIQETTGDRKKLMYASYDPLPKVIDSNLLRRKGLSNKILTGEQMRLLQDKFGE